MATAHIEFFGGPHDGRDVLIPAGTDGTPSRCLTFPDHLASPDEIAADDLPSLLTYQREHLRDDGRWRYRYVGGGARPHDTSDESDNLAPPGSPLQP